MSAADRPALGELPTLGYGAAALGNLYRAIDDAEGQAIVDAAWDAGVRYFDVAPHYGLGLAERRLGPALARRPRDDYLLSTKVGRLLVPSPETADQRDATFHVPADSRRVWDASEAGVRRSLAESCERMGVDRVDIAYLHDPDENVGEGRSLPDVVAEGLDGLARLRAEGVVRAVGVGSKSVEALLAAVRTGVPDVIMLAGRYTLLDRSAAPELLPACLERGVRVVAVGVFNSGALAEETPRPDLPFEYGAMPDAVHARVVALAGLCRRHGTTLPTAAVHFPLRHPAVAGVVLGADTPDQVRQNAARLAEDVPEALWAELDADETSGLSPASAAR